MWKWMVREWARDTWPISPSSLSRRSLTTWHVPSCASNRRRAAALGGPGDGSGRKGAPGAADALACGCGQRRVRACAGGCRLVRGAGAVAQCGRRRCVGRATPGVLEDALLWRRPTGIGREREKKNERVHFATFSGPAPGGKWKPDKYGQRRCHILSATQTHFLPHPIRLNYFGSTCARTPGTRRRRSTPHPPSAAASCKSPGRRGRTARTAPPRSTGRGPWRRRPRPRRG